MDYPSDQQTGRPESDIAGSATQPGFYWAFDDAGTAANHTDGFLGFRLRLGSDLPQPGTFDSVVIVGIDANGDGAIDMYLGADNRVPGAGQLEIWAPGASLNNSLKTTDIVTPPGQKTWVEMSSNYSFEMVTPANDPTATNFDLNGDGTNDFFISFSFPFAAVVTEMARLSKQHLAITDQTPLSFVVGTAVEANSWNEDIGGVPRKFDEGLTWTQLGALSLQYEPAGYTSGGEAPEPATWLLALAGAAWVGWRRMRH